MFNCSRQESVILFKCSFSLFFSSAFSSSVQACPVILIWCQISKSNRKCHFEQMPVIFEEGRLVRPATACVLSTLLLHPPLYPGRASQAPNKDAGLTTGCWRKPIWSGLFPATLPPYKLGAVLSLSGRNDVWPYCSMGQCARIISDSCKWKMFKNLRVP